MISQYGRKSNVVVRTEVLRAIRLRVLIAAIRVNRKEKYQRSPWSDGDDFYTRIDLTEEQTEACRTMRTNEITFEMRKSKETGETCPSIAEENQ